MSSFAQHRLQRRAKAVRWLLILTFLFLAGTFFRVQIIQGGRYRLRSDQNRLRQVPLAAPRGALLDRNGLEIAGSIPGYAVKLLAPGEDSLRAVMGRLAGLVALDSANIELVVRRYRAAPFQPALVFNSMAFEVIARLEEQRLVLPGLVIQTEPRRFYPAGRAVGHVVGYVGEVSEEDLARNRFPGARPGTVVGRDGLEAHYDSILRGREGIRYIEVSARGEMVRAEASAPGLAAAEGRSLKTTIDLPLQLFVDSLFHESLPDTRGALVAMTPSGEILALYSAPSFDPNDFVGGISREKFSVLTSAHSGLPLFNRAIKGSYPPASPFKLATAVMALRRGLVTFSSRMDQPCTGGLRYGTRVFKCWKREGHGSLDLTGAIAASCDVYFYQLGLRLGLNAMLEDGVRLGFRQATGIDLENEVGSFYPPSRSWYDRTYGPRGWTNAVTLNLAIGQGENNQTLINLLRFYQALAGDGTVHPPHLVSPRPGATAGDLGLSRAQLSGLRDAMIAVVTRGTAAASRGRELDVAGKTGTAQNPHGPDHGWFIGFAPAHRPQIVVGSIMERALHGSSVAPWVVRVIRRYLQGAGLDPLGPIEIVLPEDSAPRAEELRADTVGTYR
jgi:penicillin-binding protein 2